MLTDWYPSFLGAAEASFEDYLRLITEAEISATQGPAPSGKSSASTCEQLLPSFTRHTQLPVALPILYAFHFQHNCDCLVTTILK
ncbi:unnamed protein product [Protopolystoma xenopodis]|uniref:Uncharacterized protein n=1 Tax=Protopolystoma xenopodis TaxID=117903 RepID=A0A3S5CS40_9PLAT|nr:unnamed protein product [Protopolystoma xenopodis]